MKQRIKKIVLITICLVLVGIIIFSCYKIFVWFNENKKIEQLEKEVVNDAVIDEIDDTENTVVVKPNYEVDKEDPYWDYIKINLMDVDFKELKKTNKSTKGWLNVSGTNINYPFVQHTDNDFYLDHSFDKKYNSAGWVFVDYRNKLDGTDKNTIIYAHGRLDNSMFGSLRNIVKNSWYQDTDNHIVRISTETENTLWQVFSVYKIKTTSDYIQTEFFNDVEYMNFLEKLKNRSKFNFKTKVGINDQILTLSTCFDDDYKVVLHAKLIKRESKIKNDKGTNENNSSSQNSNITNSNTNSNVNNNNNSTSNTSNNDTPVSNETNNSESSNINDNANNNDTSENNNEIENDIDNNTNDLENNNEQSANNSSEQNQEQTNNDIINNNVENGLIDNPSNQENPTEEKLSLDE